MVLTGRKKHDPPKKWIVGNLVPIVLIVIVWYIYTSNIGSIIDIKFADESHYLSNGIRGIIEPDWGPVYSAWYYFLSFFESDSIKLYFLNYKLVMLLPVLFLYVTLRIYRVNGYMSVVLSILFLFNNLNFTTWPRVSHFAIVWIMLGLIWIRCFNSTPIKMVGIIFMMLMASFVRPEYFISFVIFCLAGLYLTIKELRLRSISKNNMVVLTVIYGLVFLMLFYIGSPLGGGERSVLAFKQHYSLNRQYHADEARNPWLNADVIVKEKFGNIASVPDALRNNPGEFIWHVKTNLISLMKIYSANIVRLADPSKQSYLVSLLLAILLIIMAVIYNMNNGPSWDEILVGDIVNSRDLMAVLVIVCAPAIVSVLLVYPRDHYIFPIISLSYIVMGVWFFQGNVENTSIGKNGIVILFVMAIAMVSPIQRVVHQKNYKYLSALRELNIKKEVNLLNSTGPIDMYLSSYNSTWFFLKGGNYFSYMKNRRINMVIPDNELLSHYKYRDDPEWKEFLKSPKEYGFERVNIENVGDVLIHKSLMGSKK